MVVGNWLFKLLNRQIKNGIIWGRRRNSTRLSGFDKNTSIAIVEILDARQMLTVVTPNVTNSDAVNDAGVAAANCGTAPPLVPSVSTGDAALVPSQSQQSGGAGTGGFWSSVRSSVYSMGQSYYSIGQYAVGNSAGANQTLSNAYANGPLGQAEQIGPATYNATAGSLFVASTSMLAAGNLAAGAYVGATAIGTVPITAIPGQITTEVFALTGATAVVASAPSSGASPSSPATNPLVNEIKYYQAERNQTLQAAERALESANQAVANGDYKLSEIMLNLRENALAYAKELEE